MGLDYGAKIYYGDEFLLTICGWRFSSNVLKCYETLYRLINYFNDKELSIEAVKNFVRNETMSLISTKRIYKSFIYRDKIDFLNKTITRPTYFTFSFDDYYDCFNYKVVEENGKFYEISEEGDAYELIPIEFDEDLLEKQEYTFEEFNKIAEFFIPLMEKHIDEDEFILNNKKVIKFYSY